MIIFRLSPREEIPSQIREDFCLRRGEDVKLLTPPDALQEKARLNLLAEMHRAPCVCVCGGVRVCVCVRACVCLSVSTTPFHLH